MTWTRKALLLQAVFFLGWIGFEEMKRIPKTVVLLETVPVDPRDLWSGKYLTLSYTIQWVESIRGFPKSRPAGPFDVAVRLVPKTKSPRAGGTPRTIWIAVEVRQGGVPKEPPDEGVWVTGTWGGRGPGVDYGIGRYYFSESRQAEMNNLRPGQFLVECGVSKDGRLTIRRIVE